MRGEHLLRLNREVAVRALHAFAEGEPAQVVNPEELIQPFSAPARLLPSRATLVEPRLPTVGGVARIGRELAEGRAAGQGREALRATSGQAVPLPQGEGDPLDVNSRGGAAPRSLVAKAPRKFDAAAGAHGPGFLRGCAG